MNNPRQTEIPGADDFNLSGERGTQMSNSNWLILACLPETTTAAKVSALMADRRQAPILSGDAFVDNENARKLTAWKMDCAEALGWGSQGIAEAHAESRPRLLDFLRVALAALKGDVR